MKIDSKKINIKSTFSEAKRKPKILLLMESKSLQEQTLSGLQMIECEYVEYENFEKIISSLMNREIDLLLLDSDCASVNVFEFLRMIYERKLQVPIVLFMKDGNPGKKQEALRHGVFDFIMKPIEPVLLERTVWLALANGRDFLNKMPAEIFERNNFAKVEMSLEKRVLAQIDKTCLDMKISRETFLQKAIQKIMAKEERVNNPPSFWSPQIITGVAWIDDQHYLLLMQIQEIYSLYNEGSDKSKISEIFKFLNNYVEVHLMQEEQMFYVLSKTERDQHLLQHQHFKSKMSELSRELLIEQNDSAILELSLYCQKWFINHIRLVDQKLVLKMKEVTEQESA